MMEFLAWYVAGILVYYILIKFTSSILHYIEDKEWVWWPPFEDWDDFKTTAQWGLLSWAAAIFVFAAMLTAIIIEIITPAVKNKLKDRNCLPNKPPRWL